MKLKTKIFLLLLIGSLYTNAQINTFDFQREILNIEDQWHKIELPNEIFGKISPDFNDIRIYGITTNDDTLQAPYIFKIKSEIVTYNEIPFKLINQSHNGNGYFYTFQISEKNLVNKIELDFGADNFDRRLILQGSQDLKEWFTIVENYRILSIKSGSADYKFTTINLPNSRYQFYRIRFLANEDPKLQSTKINYRDVSKTENKNYSIKKLNVFENKKRKETEIIIKLDSKVPVSFLKINTENTTDFYRPFTLQYLSDSVKTQKGWRYNYKSLTSGTISSLENNEFKFTSTILNQLKIIIQNYDNKPLDISSCLVQGNKHYLICRFDETADYYLVYGNKNAIKPNYDIQKFTDRIPENLKLLNLGKEQVIEKKDIQKSEPLFVNKYWLWAVLIIIILLLGGFTIRMFQKN